LAVVRVQVAQSFEQDWLDADCPNDSDVLSERTKEMLYNALTLYCNAYETMFWNYTKTQLSSDAKGDISDPYGYSDFVSLWSQYGRHLSNLHCDSVIAARQRIADRAERYRLAALEPEPVTGGGAGGDDDEGDDDELVPCPRNCGDCGGLRYGCGITRGDLRRWAEPEPEEPQDGPMEFYILTASVAQHGDCTEYYVSRSFTREEALENMRTLCQAARADAPEWRRADYDKLFWVGEESPEATPRRAPDGSYRSYCTIEHIGTLVQPVSTDNTYSLGFVTHSNLAAWHFTLAQYRELEPEYERLTALPSAWPRVGLPDPEGHEDDAAELSEDSVDSVLEEAERYADF
jgi:hypothetical protein